METSSLQVVLVQADLHWEDAPANRAHLSQLLANISAPADIIVLPEMFTTGFTMAPDRLAEPTQGPTLAWMQQWARQLDAVVTGSLIVFADGQYFNRLLWVRPDGTYRHYDKRHLFSLAGEHRHYAQGQERLVETWRGWRVMPLICYDLRFPVWSRNDLGYDLLLYVANWPDRRGAAWRALLTARAIENQAYTIGLNRVGHDGNDVYYAGDSCLIDFLGQPLAHLSAREQWQRVSLDRDALNSFRERYRFLADQDSFLIQ
ncbi:MAG: amidohydrolase [Lewinella sp.]|nr:amidohydrolase [Lewinella sp.]